jgi:hypothetical protein
MKTKELERKLLEILNDNSVNRHLPESRFIHKRDYKKIVSEFIQVLIINKII